jgi:hypothetical protein
MHFLIKWVKGRAEQVKKMHFLIKWVKGRAEQVQKNALFD